MAIEPAQGSPSRRHRIGPHLLDFDRQFWKERLLLVNVNKPWLGRLLNNHKNGKKSRRAKLEQVGRNYWIDTDLRLGENHVRAHDTVQELVDSDPWRFPLIFLSALA
jgi:hypothetical protein